MDLPNFSDLVDSKTLAGEKVKIESVIEKPIIVTGYRVSKSKYSHKGTDFCTTIQFHYEDDAEETKYVIFTGSGVIRDQIEEIAEKLKEANLSFAFRTTIQKVGNYHALT